MAYQQKYLKYKQKYINLREIVRQNGGEPTVERLLEGYKEIPNSGQQNCGIFVSDEPLEKGYIIKCERGDHRNDEKLKDAIAINRIFQDKGMLLFPRIPDKPVYDPTNNKTYIKMEKFDGDVTQLLYEHLAKLSIKKLNVDDATADALYAVYRYKMPSTVLRNEKQLMDNLMQTSANTLKFETYDAFMKQFEEDLRKMLHEVGKQMYIILMKMIEVGYIYEDNKFDNYGFTLSDKNEKHLGVTWENNKIGDKYFFIRLLDWGSGLFKIEKKEKQEKEYNVVKQYNSNFQNFSKYGQYNSNTISNYQYINSMEKNQMRDDLNKIIDAEYILKLDKEQLDETPENLSFKIRGLEQKEIQLNVLKIRALEQNEKELDKLKNIVLRQKEKESDELKIRALEQNEKELDELKNMVLRQKEKELDELKIRELRQKEKKLDELKKAAVD